LIYNLGEGRGGGMGDFVCILKVSRRVEVVFLLFKYICCDGERDTNMIYPSIYISYKS